MVEFPKTNVLFRHQPGSDERIYGDSNVNFYAQSILRRLDNSKLRKYIRAVEGKNEVGLWSEGLPYNDWTIKFTDIMHSEGLEVCGLNFPTGNPSEFWLWKDYIECIKKLDYVGLHEYGDWKLFPDLNWSTLRYKRVYGGTIDTVVGKPYFDGLTHILGYSPKLMLTEIGIDSLNKDGSHSGWKKFNQPSQYVNDLISLDKRYSVDDYVEAAFIFLCDYSDPQWESFDIGNLSALSSYIYQSNNIVPSKINTNGSMNKMKTNFDLWHEETGRNGLPEFIDHLKAIHANYLDPYSEGWPPINSVRTNSRITIINQIRNNLDELEKLL